MALTGRAAAAAALGIVLVFVAPIGGAMVLVVLAAFTLAVIVDLALAASPRAIEFRRDGDTTTRLGEPAHLTLTLVNRSGRRLHGLVRDAWPPSAGATPLHWRVDVADGQPARLASTLVPTRRGERAPAGVTVRSIGPLGLAGRQRMRTVDWQLRVLPAFTSRRVLPEKLVRLRTLDGALPTLVRGQGSEFDSLRGYVDGDDPRAIDWHATARRGTVVIRTWRPERDRQVMLVLDSGRTSAGRVGGVPRFEVALDATLLLSALSRRAGDRVGLLVHDRRTRAVVPIGRPADTLASIMRATASLEPELVETDADSMAAHLFRQLRRRSLIVLFTALEPAALEAGLLRVLPALVQRHVVVLASVDDPRIAELAAARRDADDLYAAAAAEAARAEQARIAARLRRAGVIVVTAAPDRFASVVADTYLDLKAAGRL